MVKMWLDTFGWVSLAMGLFVLFIYGIIRLGDVFGGPVVIATLIGVVVVTIATTSIAIERYDNNLDRKRRRKYTSTGPR